MHPEDADHAAAYVADIATLLAAVEDARGQPSPLVAESAEIQMHIAERHGAQRARLGWSVKALHRDWLVLGEEMARVIQRAKNLPRDAAPEAIVIVERLLEQARERSARSLQRALAPQ